MKQAKEVTADGITRVKKAFQHRNGNSSATSSQNGATTADSIEITALTPSLSNIKLQLLRGQTFGGKCSVSAFVFKHDRVGGTSPKPSRNGKSRVARTRSQQLKTEN